MPDLDLDLAAPALPHIALSPEDRAALGPLAGLKVRRPLMRGSDTEDLLLQIVEFVEAAGLEQPGDPFATVLALVKAERAFSILTRAGYPFEGLLPGLRSALDKIASAARREIVRRLLRDEIEPGLAEELLATLTSQIESGAWENWEAEIEVEAAKAVAEK
jgi:hypothetical protein